MRKRKIPLFSLETFTEIRKFDFLGFSLQYEMIYSNVLNMLDLAGIPLWTSERGADVPFIVGGGPCVYNTEPIADFFDLFLLGEGEEVEKTSVVVEVNGRRVEVKLPASLGTAAPAASGKAKKPTRRDRGGAKASAPSSNAVASPMQGTIVKVAVSEGDTVAEGDLVVVLEAMKMEQPLNAHRAGVVKGLSVEAGQTVASGDTLCEIVDAE